MNAPGPDDEHLTPGPDTPGPDASGPDETEPLRQASPPSAPPGYPTYDQPPSYGATPPPPPPQPLVPPPPVGYAGYDGAAVPQACYYAGVNHQNATTSMWLGITGLAGVLLTPICCVTLPLLLCSPVAWVMGARARSTIDSTAPGTFANRGQAQAGFVLGVIGCVLGVLAVIALVAFGALLLSATSTAAP